MATPARRAALRVLLDVEKGAHATERLADAALDSLPPRDRSLVQELVLGTLRRRGRVDQTLQEASERGLARLDPAVLAILRLGAHQLLHLRLPAHAAVAESVDLSGELRPRAKGFVNAVLRRIARDGPPPEADPVADPLAWLTTSGSLPAWLASRWLGRLGPDRALARARALLETPPETFRLNPRVPDAWSRVEAAGLRPRTLLVPGALAADGARSTGLAAAGVLYFQDEGSQAVAHLAATPGLVLDACAAPGGKAALLADIAPGRTRVVALEASPRRLRTLAALLGRWGTGDAVLPLGGDALRPPLGTSFDAVLLDAPCSGLGTLGRHPEIRWRAREPDLLRHAARQAALLESVSRLVRPGGLLVYATCSLEPEEDERVVEAFLSSNPAFLFAPLPPWAAPIADGGFLRTAPEVTGGDGFFAARLTRRG